MTKPCFRAHEGRGVAVEACLSRTDRSVKLSAKRSDGTVVGKAILDTARGRVVVGEIEVAEEARRSGVGTALYEAAVKVACKAGLDVSSDSFRSPYAESFWRKQVAKGRATCVPGHGNVYDAPARGKSTAGLPVPERDSAGDPAWPCARYVARVPCLAVDLSGAGARTQGRAKTPSRTRARAHARRR